MSKKDIDKHYCRHFRKRLSCHPNEHPYLMNLFSFNAFLFGALVFLTMSFSNVIYVWLCKIWKIKILEFSVFFNPGFSLHKKEVNGTLYQLGWLPIGVSIKPLGMLPEEAQKLAAEDVPFTFFSKSKAKQAILRQSSVMACLFTLVVSLFILKGPGNIIQAIAEMYNYISFAIDTMFGLHSHSEFEKATSSILVDKNIIVFALTLFISVLFVLTQLSTITNMFAQDGKINGLIRLLGFAAILFVMYLTFWKIPKFVFSFFSFGQIMSYIVSFILGGYIIGTLIFILATMLAKLNTPQK